MKREKGNFDYKEVEVEIERQSIGNEEVFHIKTAPMIWGLTETFDDATEAAAHLSRYIENTLLAMAHNNANKIRIKYTWE